MSRQLVSQALNSKLELLNAFEIYSQNLLTLSVDHWDEYLEKRSEVIAQINKINVVLAQHIVTEDELIHALKLQINTKMQELQQLEIALNTKASDMRKELLDQIKNNNQSHKIRKFVFNTHQE